ncbi:MAG: hypothetical protein OXH91_01075 [Chloroflexota bacterium]|nr:hypothetical protein [Chloroflexota bacterium]
MRRLPPLRALPLLALLGVFAFTLAGATPAAASGPCQVTAAAVNGPGGVDLVAGSPLSTPLAITIDCDRPARVKLRAPGGGFSEHWVAGPSPVRIDYKRAYLCHGQSARVLAYSSDLNWSAAVPINGLGALPQCDVLLRRGSTWVKWTGPRTAIGDAFAGRALGWLNWERNGGGTVPGLTVWSLVPGSSPLILGWGDDVPRVLSGLSHLVPGRSYLLVSDRDRAWTFPRPPTRRSVFEDAQVVSFYGHPNVPVMGVLGHGSPAEVADEIAVWAARYDALNGPRAVIPAYHLITGVAQANPTADGTWLYRLPRAGIAPYVEAARERGMLLFLDVQIGWSDPLREVQLLEEFLREPFVHMALDPEFATETSGLRPGLAIGGINADQINAVQHYLADLSRQEGIPPKILMVHQFTAHMIEDRAAIESVDDVELSIDMDGFGGIGIKLRHYGWYALTAPSERPAFKIFFDQDTPPMTPEQVQAIDRRPDLIMYQ